jgi:hypothetical protein
MFSRNLFGIQVMYTWSPHFVDGERKVIRIANESDDVYVVKNGDLS